MSASHTSTLRWYQFSLRDMLALTAICALLAAWYRDHTILMASKSSAAERTAATERALIADNDRLTDRNRLALKALAQAIPVDEFRRVIQCEFPPLVSGLVTSIHPAEGLVEINLGSDDGLKNGLTMDVARFGGTLDSTKYVGQIQLISVDKSASLGRIVRLASGVDAIQVKDQAMIGLEK